MPTAIAIIGIVICIGFLYFLILRNVDMTIAGIICSLLVIIITGQPLIETFNNVFLPSAGSLVTTFFGTFMAGTFFGKIYQCSGAAKSIARGVSKLSGKNNNPIIGIVCIYAAGMILMYGGVTGLPVTFVLVPIGLEIMRRANIPTVMAPGIIMGVVFTSGVCMPGAPQLNNVVLMQMLGTKSAAGLVAGLIGGVVVLIINILYMSYAIKRYHKLHGNVAEDVALDSNENDKIPSFWLAIIPLILVFVLFNVLKWNIVFCLFSGTIVGLVLFWKNFDRKQLLPQVTEGVKSIAVIISASCAISGFGAVIASAPAFQVISDAMVSIPGPKLIMVAIAVAVVTFVCGSGLVGLTTSIPMFAQTFTSAGVSLNALHRVAAFASTTLDSMPTNTMFILTNGLCKTDIKESYKYVFVTTVVNTGIGTLVVALVMTFFPGLI